MQKCIRIVFKCVSNPIEGIDLYTLGLTSISIWEYIYQGSGPLFFTNQYSPRDCLAKIDFNLRQDHKKKFPTSR